LSRHSLKIAPKGVNINKPLDEVVVIGLKSVGIVAMTGHNNRTPKALRVEKEV
jgi:hypothetical protein